MNTYVASNPYFPSFDQSTYLAVVELGSQFHQALHESLEEAKEWVEEQWKAESALFTRGDVYVKGAPVRVVAWFDEQGWH